MISMTTYLKQEYE